MSQFFWPAVLLFATFALIGLELIIPSGGVLGVFAILAYVASIVSAFAAFGFEWGTLYLIASMVIASVLGAVFVRTWPKTAIGKRVFGTPPTASDVIPERHRQLDAMVGSRGVAISTMLPSGTIRVDGKLIDAVSEGVVIEVDSPVEIVKLKDNHVVVRPIKTTSTVRTEDEVKSAMDKPIDLIVPDPFEDT